jgi:hypothetical protein
MDADGAAADAPAGARVDQVSESTPASGGQARAGFRDAKRLKDGAAADSGSASASTSSSGSASGSASGRGRSGAAADKGVRGANAAGDDLSSREMIDEMKAGRGKIVAAIVLAIVIAVVLIVYAVTSP